MYTLRAEMFLGRVLWINFLRLVEPKTANFTGFMLAMARIVRLNGRLIMK